MHSSWRIDELAIDIQASTLIYSCSYKYVIPRHFAGRCEIHKVWRRNSFDWNDELPEAAGLSIEFHNHYTNMSKAGQKEVKCKFFLQAIIMYMETSQISFWQGSQNSRHLYQKLCICAAFIDIYHWKVIVGGLSMRRDVLPQF